MPHYIFIGAIWQSWEIIVGGIFLGLAIYSYFHRVKVILKRENEINNIKQILIEMDKLSDKTKDELMHEALEYKIYRISNEMKTANKVLMIKIDTEFGMLNARFNGISDTLESLNGRVTVLENDVEPIRLSKKYKKILFFAIVGLITLFNIEGIMALIKKIIPF